MATIMMNQNQHTNACEWTPLLVIHLQQQHHHHHHHHHHQHHSCPSPPLTLVQAPLLVDFLGQIWVPSICHHRLSIGPLQLSIEPLQLSLPLCLLLLLPPTLRTPITNVLVKKSKLSPSRWGRKVAEENNTSEGIDTHKTNLCWSCLGSTRNSIVQSTRNRAWYWSTRNDGMVLESTCSTIVSIGRA